MKIEIGFKLRKDPTPLTEWHRWFALLLAHRWHDTKVTFIVAEQVQRRQRDGEWEYRPAPNK